METPHPPAHKLHCQRPRHRTAQKCGAGVQDDQDICSAPSVGQEANSAPGTNPREGLQGEDTAKVRGQSGPKLPTQNPDWCFDLKDPQLPSPYYSSCHKVSVQGRLMGHFMGAHVFSPLAHLDGRGNLREEQKG